MAIRSYEIMFLLDSGKYASNPEGVTAEVNEILSKIEAEVIAARPWMDGKLAYPIEGHRKGLHYLAYVKADSLKVQQLQRLCRLSSVVLRHMCIVPPPQLFDLLSAQLLDPNAVVQSVEAIEDAVDADEEVSEIDEDEVLAGN